MSTFEKKIVKLLKENDCVFARHGKGDHDIWFSPKTNTHFTVDSKIKSRFTANAIMKQAGIKFHF
jgi:hypothetical protein